MYLVYSAEMAEKKQLQMVHLRLEQAMLDRLDDLRFKYRFESRTEAIRWLLDWALGQNPKPKKS